MVTRKRLRSILSALGLYVLATLLVVYVGVNAFSGNHGLKAKQDIDLQIASMSAELEKVRLERMQLERRIALLKARRLDPDMLDERARALLDYAHPHDLTLMFEPPRPRPASGPCTRRHLYQHIFAANGLIAGTDRAAPTSAISRIRLWVGTSRYLEDADGRCPNQESRTADGCTLSGRGGRSAEARPGIQQGRGVSRAQANVADQAFRRESRSDVRHGPDWRLLPSLYRPGGRRC